MAKKISYYEELEKLKQYLNCDTDKETKSALLSPLFQKLFGKDKFKIESNANGADVYIEGTLLVEAKTKYNQWLKGFYQAFHYQRKFGLTYNTVLVIAHQFVGIWRVDKLPKEVVEIIHTTEVSEAPNKVGNINAEKTKKNSSLVKAIQDAAIYWLEPSQLADSLAGNSRSLIVETFEILKILQNLDANRQQINPHNFIQCIERMKVFFENPIDAVHCFYSIVALWDNTARLATNALSNEIRLIGLKGHFYSDPILIPYHLFGEFNRFIENQYVFTNEGSGLTADYYFSRFDEVLAAIDADYVKQHGIFFTNDNLCKFALWWANTKFADTIAENYIFFDPAGGSGNLVSAWRGKLKHKIISELQPDLLKTIDMRMKSDYFHLETGFTVIPDVSDGKGLNFLDCSAAEYWQELAQGMEKKNLALDSPIAFLMNPPYKNTDENDNLRQNVEASYEIHPSILALTGEDAARERYLAFLGQVLNLAKHQNTLQPQSPNLVLVFSPTSWLLPRASYQPFREVWDAHFEYMGGIIVTSNEWFKLNGKWPVAFTVWKYRKEIEGETAHKHTNTVKVLDFSSLKKADLNLDWNEEKSEIDKILLPLLNNAKEVVLDNSRGDIRQNLPLIGRRGEMVQQGMVNLYRNRTREELNQKIISGFPLKDDNHFKLNDPYGYADGTFVGFMGDNTPVRLRQEPSDRFSNKPDRVWFLLMTAFAKVNMSVAQGGPATSRAYCAYDWESAKVLFSWFGISKAINGKYPIWANQYDIWSPNIKPELAEEWYHLCCAFVLAENRCIVTKFEANNPLQSAPEIFVDNPLCPVHPDNFWKNIIETNISFSKEGVDGILVNAIKDLYKTWNMRYCKGSYLFDVGLKDEPYFRYFDYSDFLTPHSGLIQIQKYAKNEGLEDLLSHFREIENAKKEVAERLYEMLVVEMAYFT